MTNNEIVLSEDIPAGTMTYDTIWEEAVHGEVMQKSIKIFGRTSVFQYSIK